MQLCNVLLAWLSLHGTFPSACRMEQFVCSTASSTTEMWAETNVTTHNGSQGGKWQCVVLRGTLCAVVGNWHHHIWGAVGWGRVWRDDTWCPWVVQVGSSSCQHWEGSLLPMCDIYSFYLVLIDLPQCSRRCPAQGRVGGWLRKRQKGWGESRLVRCPLCPVICYPYRYCPVLQTASDADFLLTCPHSLLF